LRPDGTVACWGTDDSGSTTPPTGVLFTRLVGGWNAYCGVTTSGETRCWGSEDPANPLTSPSSVVSGNLNLAVGNHYACQQLGSSPIMKTTPHLSSPSGTTYYRTTNCTETPYAALGADTYNATERWTLAWSSGFSASVRFYNSTRTASGCLATSGTADLQQISYSGTGLQQYELRTE
jgi:hypothetical protein